MFRRPLAFACAFILPFVLAGPGGARSAPEGAPLHWTDETPDAMVLAAEARAEAKGATQGAALASLAIVASLADGSADGRARGALERVAGSSLDPEVRADAALLARSLSADEATDAGALRDEQLGVVDALSLLGPFRDTGGGLDAHDGPEAKGQSFGETRATYSWGSYEVAWLRVPRLFASAAGVPLDLFVHPRKESCAWLATKLTADADQKIVVRLASSGQVRLAFDGVDVARDASVHQSARFDRLAARVRVTAGSHLLAAKICSGALGDDGRTRLRVTDESGAAPKGVRASADLSGLSREGRSPSSPKRAFIERLETPLFRVLAEPSRVALPLEAAVVRTLGGADDLRSPRAPGMLVSIADGASDADRLAMVSWVTPSGANRSAWLHRARAAASGDSKARAFIERRVVERHLEAGLADWAMASLRGSQLDSRMDADAVVLSAETDIALGSDALKIRAMRRLEAYARQQKDAPSALLELLAEVARPFDRGLVLEVRERLAARGELGAARVSALEIRDQSAVAAAAERAFAGGLQDADDGIAVAKAVARAGAHDAALRLYEQLARWAPNRGEVWAALAHETSAAPEGPTRDEATRAALRRARELDPSDARDRAELALRGRGPAGGQASEDEHYLVSSQTFLARRATPLASAEVASIRPSSPSAKASPSAPRQAAPVPDVADRELHWLRAVVMHPDRRASELVHYAREIVIAPRTEEELYEDIPAEGELTEIVRARVHRKDGVTAFAVEEANDNARPRIRWPELAAGDVVEVAFRSWTAGPVGGRGDPPFYRLDYAGALSTHPVLYNEVDVESPTDRPIYVDVVNGQPQRREEKDENGSHRVRLVWDRPANVLDEPLAPALSEVVPTVVLSTFKDWPSFRAWYAEATRGFTEPDAQVRELAAKLTAGKATSEAKLRAVFDFVADDIRYVNYVSGEWWLPNRPQQLLARREGDCDDKALLLITLLKAVGIEAEEVLVQTRLTGQPSLLLAPGAAVPLFDHGIAYLPGPSGGTYLDATSPQSRLGPLPSMDARAVALRMSGPPQVVQLPSSSPDDHGVTGTWTIGLHADGSADLRGEEHATGDDAFWMRSNLTEVGARAAWVEEHLAQSWFPSVEVDKDVAFEGDLPRGAARVGWRARSQGLARHEGDELVVPLSPAQPMASQLAPLVTRTLPVVLPPYLAPRKEVRTIRVVAPKGWAFEPLPPGGDENGGPFGRAHIDIAKDPSDESVVLVKRTVVMDKSTVSVEEYPQWRAWVQRVDALMHRSVRLAEVSSKPMIRRTP